MIDSLNLNEIYNGFSSKKINSDIVSVHNLLSELECSIENELNIDLLNNFIIISNKVTALTDKLFAYARLHLYLNTNDINAYKLKSQIETLDLKFKKYEIMLSDKLSYKIISEYSLKSDLILEHKEYLMNLLNHTNIQINDLNKLTLEKEYQKLISDIKINVKNATLPINLTVFDFNNNSELYNLKKDYFDLRELYFSKKKNEFANLMLKIKKETIKVSIKNKYSTPLEMSILSSNFTMEQFNNLINIIKSNEDIFQDFFSSYHKKNSIKNLYTYTEIQEIIINSFKNFNSDLACLAKKMFKNNYIDVSNNNNKIVGSCHLKIIDLKESRIVGHYSGNIKDIFNIAHEIGHAYQNYLIMNSQSPLNSNVPTSTCEIISIFCELLILDYFISNCKNNDELIYVFNYFINYIVQAILDVFSRFLFEDKVFNLLEKNEFEITPDYLSKLMESIQSKIYQNNYNYIDKFLWIYKPHFYSIYTPYYNYPYSFGILYAYLLFDKYKNENPIEFNKKFKQFCKLSSRLNISDLSNIFNIDLISKNCFDISFVQIKKLIEKYLGL